VLFFSEHDERHSNTANAYTIKLFFIVLIVCLPTCLRLWQSVCKIVANAWVMVCIRFRSTFLVRCNKV
jgi:hypothetical protein